MFVKTTVSIMACAVLMLSGGIYGWSFGEEPAESGWHAGVAVVDITPEEPLWLGGYAARTKPAESTLLPLHAKALALRDASGKRAVLVTADILDFPKAFAERIRVRVESDYSLTRDELILGASHTHSAPIIGTSLKCIYTFDEQEEQKLMAYADALEAKIVALVGQALENLAPATLYSGTGIARFAVNRRNNKESELTATTPLEGPQDHGVPVLKVARPDGGITAVVFGYACHATTLDGYAYCGDYPGFAQAAVEVSCPGATALFFAGCGGDQNPLPRRSVALARQYGATLAAAVARVLEDPMTALEPRLATTYNEVDLALAPAPGIDELRKQAETAAGYQERCLQALLDRFEREGSLPSSYPYPVQAWRLGDQLVVALGGEVVVGYAVAIKERFGQETFVMAYANDVLSYIPTEEVLAGGGYEGQSAQLIYGLPAPWASGIEARILAEVEARVNALQQ